MTLVLLDADVVGRARTGDESYTVGLLRELPGVAHDLRFACSLRDLADLPADVPAEVERHALPVASPYRRIPFVFPRLARRVGAALVHVHYFVAPALPCPAVLTVHDLSFQALTLQQTTMQTAAPFTVVLIGYFVIAIAVTGLFRLGEGWVARAQGRGGKS